MTTHNRYVSMALGVLLVVLLAQPALAAVRIGGSGDQTNRNRLRGDSGSTLLPLPGDLEQHLGDFDPNAPDAGGEPDLGGIDPGLLDQTQLIGGGGSGATVQTRVPTPEPGAGVLLGLGLVLLGSARRRRCIIDG
jgi:hypothetical protein